MDPNTQQPSGPVTPQQPAASVPPVSTGQQPALPDNTTTPVEATMPLPPTPPEPAAGGSKKALYLVVTVGILGLAAFGGYFFMMGTATEKEPTIIAKPQVSPTTTPVVTKAPEQEAEDVYIEDIEQDLEALTTDVAGL